MVQGYAGSGGDFQASEKLERKILKNKIKILAIRLATKFYPSQISEHLN